MNEFIKKLLNDFLTHWKKLSRAQQILVVSLVIIIVTGFIFLMSWIRQPHYVVLYSNLKEDDAGLIVDKIKELKIEYRLSVNGTTIEVPAKNVYDLRLELAKAGLPGKTESGYELFDQNKLGMSDFMQKISYRRALEGELMRTIQQMNEIELARVHLVLPEPSLFEEDKRDPTASIVLKLKPGAQLQESQIRGIAHLVSGSVEGLEPENINILDFYGNVLSKNQEKDSILGLSSTQLEFKIKVDRYLSTKIQSIFDNVLGPNNSIVRVDAELDFRQVEKTSEIYEPENASVRSEEIVQESSAADANNPKQLEHSTTNYEINKTVQHVLDKSGNIKRLSIAILVNGSYKTISRTDPETEEETTVSEYVPRSQEELDQLAQIAKNSVGFDAVRNDQITVNNLQFDTDRRDKEMMELEKFEKRQFWISILQKVGLGLVVLIFLLYIRSLVNQVIIKRVPDKAADVGVEEEEDQLSAVEKIEEEISEDAKQMKAEHERIQAYAQKNPKEMARLIKTWLEEDGE